MIKIEILDYIIYESFQKLETLYMMKEWCPPWRKTRKLHEHRKETYIQNRQDKASWPFIIWKDRIIKICVEVKKKI